MKKLTMDQVLESGNLKAVLRDLFLTQNPENELHIICSEKTAAKRTFQALQWGAFNNIRFDIEETEDGFAIIYKGKLVKRNNTLADISEVINANALYELSHAERTAELILLLAAKKDAKFKASDQSILRSLRSSLIAIARLEGHKIKTTFKNQQLHLTYNDTAADTATP